jgi:hypothetical protein
MKNKKKQFESLKTKLKNLYFKRSLKIDKKNNVFKLFVEKGENGYDLPIPEKVKTSEKIWIKEEKKTPQIFTKLLPSVITRNIVKNSVKFLSKYTVPEQFRQNVESKYTVPKKIKTDTISSNNIQHVNYTTEKIKNEKGYTNYQNVLPKFEKKQPNKQNTNIVNKNHTISNEMYRISSPEIKFLDTPEKIKNIHSNSISNTINYDMKTLYIPSKEELINLKNSIVNKTKNIFTTSKNFIQQSTNNFVTNFGDEKKIGIKKAVYALPAYYDGTAGPVKQDTIARIHKNEVVLTANQAKELKGDKSGIVKNSNDINLKPAEAKTRNYSSDEIQTSDNTPSKPNDPPSGEKKETTDLSIPPTESALRMSQASENTDLDKVITSIENNLGSPLYMLTIEKNKSLPVWRATLG